MSNPFASIWEDVPIVKQSAPVVKPKKVVDHSEAKAIYEAYLVKAAELKVHQDYAIRIAKATYGPSMTPVYPLACMGTNGGPLRCDHCGHPMILESGAYYNVYADDAWARNASKDQKWVSYIKRGMIVRIVENETLRIYHGYDGIPTECCTLGMATINAMEAKYVRDTSKLTKIFKYLEATFTDKTHAELNEMLTAVAKVMFSFDPGYGVNRP